MTYMITVLTNISDYSEYMLYGIAAKKIVESFGGRFIIHSYKNFTVTAIEGDNVDVVNIAVFKDKDSYLKFYHSPDYQKLIPLRNKICKSQIIMLEKEFYEIK